jgi:hypothetical protein
MARPARHVVQRRPRSEPPPLEEGLVFVLARRRGNETDSMFGSLRPRPHGCEALLTLNGELYQSQWFASEALARAYLAKQQDTFAAAGWVLVVVQS